jgi:predicted nucleic acid-binding protein
VLTVDANVWVAASDPRDRFRDASVAFLRAAAERGLELHAPAFLLNEVGCALARRAGDKAVGVSAAERLRSHPSLILHALDEPLLALALDIGVRQLLRAADALYAATSMLARAPLITWDNELVSRAGAMTPDGWLAR